MLIGLAAIMGFWRAEVSWPVVLRPRAALPSAAAIAIGTASNNMQATVTEHGRAVHHLLLRALKP